LSAVGQDFNIAIRRSGSEATPPNSERVKDAFARVGYSIEASIADLIDNSIDAQATEVLVRLIHDGKKVIRIAIADNGRGMTEAILRDAMRFGSTLPHKKEDLGKYGIGLKSASFSQCDEFSVVTRAAGKTAGRRWSSSSLDKDWLCDTLDPSDCSILLGADWAGVSVATSGTVVIWDKLSCLRAGSSENSSELIDRTVSMLGNHLGLVFHRFLENRHIRILIDSQLSTKSPSKVVQIVEGLDPFSYPRSGAVGYPKDFQVSIVGVGEMTLHAHIWPKNSKEPGYRLGGGRVSARQGFYFYRNDRLIQAGGWNGLRRDDAEPHFSLARVAVNLPVSGHFDVSIQKTSVNVPDGFVEAVEASRCGSVSFTDFVNRADEVYRTKSRAQDDDDYLLVPWHGLSEAARETARRILAPEEKRVRKVSFVWENLDRGLVFEVDFDRDRIRLNEAYRKLLLNGGRRSKHDAQVIKTLLFLLVRKCFDKKVISRKIRDELEVYNQVLLRCLQ
jgi:hypothetical protein